MVKEPHPGRVKTRLGRDIGMVPAAWWFRHQTKRLIRKLARDPRWQTVLAVSPDGEGLTSRVWPEGVSRTPQGRGNLGDRMARQMRAISGDVVVIGADIPGITPARIMQAFHALGTRDAVIGPAPDGGYWLVGTSGRKAQSPTLMKNVRWSTRYAMEDTIASMDGLSIAQIDTLRDADTAADLAALEQLK